MSDILAGGRAGGGEGGREREEAAGTAPSPTTPRAAAQCGSAPPGTRCRPLPSRPPARGTRSPIRAAPPRRLPLPASNRPLATAARGRSPPRPPVAGRCGTASPPPPPHPEAGGASPAAPRLGGAPGRGSAAAPAGRSPERAVLAPGPVAVRAGVGAASPAPVAELSVLRLCVFEKPGRSLMVAASLSP